MCMVTFHQSRSPGPGTSVHYLGTLLESRDYIVFVSFPWPGSHALGQVLLVTTETLQPEMVILCHLKHVLILLAIMWMYFKFILFLPENKLNDAKKG